MPDPMDLFDGLRPVPEIAAADCWALDHALAASAEPFVVRGLVAAWPLVAEGAKGPANTRAYLAAFARDTDFTFAEGAPGAGARIFYDDAMAMNHRTRRARIGAGDAATRRATVVGSSSTSSARTRVFRRLLPTVRPATSNRLTRSAKHSRSASNICRNTIGSAKRELRQSTR